MSDDSCPAFKIQKPCEVSKCRGYNVSQVLGECSDDFLCQMYFCDEFPCVCLLVCVGIVVGLICSMPLAFYMCLCLLTIAACDFFDIVSPESFVLILSAVIFWIPSDVFSCLGYQ